MAEALRIQDQEIVRSGFVLQIDAPDLALERHVSYKDQPISKFLSFVEDVIAVINAALRNIPRDRVRIHVCWGNSELLHDFDVPLQDILPVVRQAKVGGFVLPFANPRHAHEFRCFERMPLDDDQILIAGVIDPLTNIVEHPEVVSDRLERVAAVIGDPSRVLAGHPLRLPTPRPVGDGLRRTSSGQSCAASRMAPAWHRSDCSRWRDTRT